MIRLSILVFLLLASPAVTQDANDVIVREGLDPVSGAVVGQHVTLHIDVLFHNEMPKPPRVGLSDVPGVQILRFETQGTTIRETISGQTYVGQRFEYALYPRRGGTFEILPASVTLLDKAGDPVGKAHGERLRLQIKVPPNADISQPLVATAQLTFEQHWTPAPTTTLKAGDAMVRIITRRAEDVPGLAMVDLPATAPEGVRVYADAPDIEDQTNRGIVTGQRIDRITYVFERGGAFVLPPLKQPWWDLKANSLKTAEAFGTTVNVTAITTPTSAAAFQTLLRLTALVALFIISTSGLCYFLFRRHISNPERGAFQTLRHSCSGRDARRIYQAFSHWRSFLSPSKSAATCEAATKLQSLLFSSDPPTWSKADSAQLLSELKAIRKHPSHKARIGALPPLNP